MNMKVEYSSKGTKHVICDNLREFFAEFKKYRDAKKNIAKKENFGEHVFPVLEWNDTLMQGLGFIQLFSLDLDFKKPNEEPFWWKLKLDVSTFNIKASELHEKWEPEEEKDVNELVREDVHSLQLSIRN